MTTPEKSYGCRMAMWSKPCSRNQASRLRWSCRNQWWERSRTFMSSLTNIACRSPRLQRCGLAIGLACLAIAGHAQDTGIRAPSDAIAGNAATIGASGGGSATFFLVGPSNTLKREVQLGQDIALAPKELHSAGRYV